MTELIPAHPDLPVYLSSIALLVSFWTFYRNWLMDADIRVSVGDSIDLIQHSIGPELPQSIQIACTFSNMGGNIGVLEKLVLIVQPHGKPKQIIDWAIFYEYKDGRTAAPKERVHSIPILPKSTHFQGIQFSTGEHEELEWAAGLCRLELIGWVNRDCKMKPNLRREMKFEISESLLRDMEPVDRPLTQPIIHKVALEGYKVWELNDIVK